MFNFIATLGLGASQSLDEDDLDLANPRVRFFVVDIYHTPA